MGANRADERPASRSGRRRCSARPAPVSRRASSEGAYDSRARVCRRVRLSASANVGDGCRHVSDELHAGLRWRIHRAEHSSGGVGDGDCRLDHERSSPADAPSVILSIILVCGVAVVNLPARDSEVPAHDPEHLREP